MFISKATIFCVFRNFLKIIFIYTNLCKACGIPVKMLNVGSGKYRNVSLSAKTVKSSITTFNRVIFRDFVELPVLHLM